VSWRKRTFAVLAIASGGAVSAASGSGSSATEAADPTRSVVRLGRVTFLLPESTMQARITSQLLASYIRVLVARAESVANASPRPAHHPTTLMVTVAVRPSGDRRVWVDSVESAMASPELLSSFQTALLDVPTPRPSGLIVFQCLLWLWGGKNEPDAPALMPKTWKAAGCPTMDVESFVERTWDR
jgi:hypothetical protein